MRSRRASLTPGGLRTRSPTLASRLCRDLIASPFVGTDVTDEVERFHRLAPHAAAVPDRVLATVPLHRSRGVDRARGARWVIAAGASCSRRTTGTLSGVSSPSTGVPEIDSAGRRLLLPRFDGPARAIAFAQRSDRRCPAELEHGGPRGRTHGECEIVGETDCRDSLSVTGARISALAQARRSTRVAHGEVPRRGLRHRNSRTEASRHSREYPERGISTQ